MIYQVVYSPVAKVLSTPLLVLCHLSCVYTVRQAFSRLTLTSLLSLFLIFTDDLNPFPEAKHRSYDVFQLLVPTNLKVKKQELFPFAKLPFGFI